MAPDQFFNEEAARVLTPGAFEFGLDGELRRAIRSQNFLTLVVLEVHREREGLEMTADEVTVDEVASVIGRGVRDTDLLGKTDKGRLSLVLLDADLDSSTHVINRLVSRLDNYDFPTPLRISIGAAYYPTDADDAGSLTRQAASHPLVSWRGGTKPRSATPPR